MKEGDWYYEFVKELYEKGIVNGMSADTFAPDSTLTRARISKIISGLIK